MHTPPGNIRHVHYIIFVCVLQGCVRIILYNGPGVNVLEVSVFLLVSSTNPNAADAVGTYRVHPL